MTKNEKKKVAGSLVTGLVLGVLMASSCQKQVTVEVPVEKIVEVEKVVEKVVEKKVFVRGKRVVKNICEYPPDSGVKVVINNPETKYNRLYISGGVGPNGLSVETSPSSVKVSQKKEPIFGLGYQRKLEDFVVGVEVRTNGSVVGTVGQDF